MTIGERILNLIKEKGMTQKEFSDLTGIPQSTLSCWKTKKQSPGMDKLQVICDVLKVDPYYLVSGTEMKDKYVPDSIQIYKDDQEYKIIVEYRKLDKERKSRLLGYLDALTEIK